MQALVTKYTRGRLALATPVTNHPYRAETLMMRASRLHAIVMLFQRTRCRMSPSLQQSSLTRTNKSLLRCHRSQDQTIIQVAQEQKALESQSGDHAACTSELVGVGYDATRLKGVLMSQLLTFTGLVVSLAGFGE